MPARDSVSSGLKKPDSPLTANTVGASADLHRIVIQPHLFARSPLFELANIQTQAKPCSLKKQTNPLRMPVGARLYFVSCERHSKRKQQENAILKAIRENNAKAAVIDSKPFSADFFKNLPPNFLLCRFGVGTNNIDFQLCQQRGIHVCTTKGASALATAEHSFAQMLALARHTIPLNSLMQQGQWCRYQGLTLNGKTLCILGLGDVGTEVARIAIEGFAMRVFALVKDTPSAKSTRNPVEMHKNPVAFHAHAMGKKTSKTLRRLKKKKGEDDQPMLRCFTRKALPKILGQSDIVSLHLPLTIESKNILSAKMFHAMKKGALLINTARAGLIDEQAMIESLKSSSGIAGAGIDVFPDEPYHGRLTKLASTSLSHYEGNSSDHRPLNLILSPHIASHTDEANMKTAQAVIDNIKHFLTYRQNIKNET